MIQSTKSKRGKVQQLLEVVAGKEATIYIDLNFSKFTPMTSGSTSSMIEKNYYIN